jgi:hypothetical protein
MIERRASSNKVTGRIICFLIILAAACLRLLMVSSGYPYISYIDEGHVLHPIIRMLKFTTWDPGWYVYPSMLMYCIAIPAKIYFFLKGIIFNAPPIFLNPIGPVMYYDIIEPPELIIIGRLTVVAFSTGIVFLVWHLGSRLMGFRGGVIAALAAALMPALAGRGSIVSTDTPATFFIWASICCSYYIPCRKIQRLAIALAGAFTGFAFTTKYPAGAVGAVAVIAIFVLKESIRRRLKFVFLFFLSAVTAVLISMPALILRFKNIYSFMAGEWNTQFSTTHAYATKAKFSFIDQLLSPMEVGLFLFVVSIIGCCYLLYKQQTRNLMIGVICFTGIVLAVFVPSHFRPFRHLLPLVPLLCLGIGACGTMLINIVKVSRVRNVLTAGFITILIFITIPPLYNLISVRISNTDTRSTIINWLVAHTQKNAKIWVGEEIAFFPGELQRVQGNVLLVPENKIQNSFQIMPQKSIIIMSFEGFEGLRSNGFFSNSSSSSARQPLVTTLLTSGSIKPTRDSRYWKTNDQKIIVLQKR